MINGQGVGRMYNAVMDGRSRELHDKAKTLAHIAAIPFQLEDFRDTLREGTIQELKEWYDLYSDSAYENPIQKKRKGLK